MNGRGSALWVGILYYFILRSSRLGRLVIPPCDTSRDAEVLRPGDGLSIVNAIDWMGASSFHS